MHRGKDKAAMKGDMAQAGELPRLDARSTSHRWSQRKAFPAGLAILPDIMLFNLILRYRHHSINQAVVNW